MTIEQHRLYYNAKRYYGMTRAQALALVFGKPSSSIGQPPPADGEAASPKRAAGRHGSSAPQSTL